MWRMCTSVDLFIYIYLPLLLLIHRLNGDTEFYEGSACQMEDDTIGNCTKITQCDSRLREVLSGRRKPGVGHCTFIGFIEVVCCKIDTDPSESRLVENMRPAEKACKRFQYLQQKLPEVDIVFNIVAGIEVEKSEFPYIAALGYKSTDDEDVIKYSCGATLIASEFLLTAAHCVNNVNEQVPVEARFGSTDLTDESPRVQRVPISTIISHPMYKRTQNYYDIAILKLKQPVKLQSTVVPACIQTHPIENMISNVDKPLVTAGWGATDFGEDGSSVLLKTPGLELIKLNECRPFYKGFGKLPTGLSDSMICALDTNITRNSDACQGDSGGPLLYAANNSHTLVGITSFGQICGSPTPSVYTSVLSYLDWIEKIVWL